MDLNVSFRRLMPVLLLLFSFLLQAQAPAAEESAREIQEIRANQKGIATVEAGFKQEKHTQLLERPIRSKGSLYFKSPVGVRWIYEGSMEVVYNGKTIFIYFPDLKEAERIEGASGYAGPLSFDIETLLEDYTVTATRQNGEIRLDLKPNKEMPFASMRMVFEPAAAFPREVTILEESGDRTVISFTDIKYNVKLSDKLFRFAPPPGVEIRSRDLTR